MDIAKADEFDTEPEMDVLSNLFTSDVVVTVDMVSDGLLD